MADDWSSIAGVLGTVLLSGLVGALLGALLSPWLTQRLEEKRQQRKEVLDPMYDYVADLDSHEPEQVLPISPWSSVPLSTRRRLKEKIRTSIEVLSESAKEFAAANSRLNQHLVTVKAGIIRPFSNIFAPNYRDGGVDQILGASVGMHANWTVAIDVFFDRAYPQLIRYLDDPAAAWRAVMRSQAAQLNFIDQVVSFLLGKDPMLLDRLHDACTTHAMAKESIEVVKDLDDKHGALLVRAQIVRRLLEPDPAWRRRIMLGGLLVLSGFGLFIAGFLRFGENLAALILLTVVAFLLTVCGKLVIATYHRPGSRDTRTK